MCLSVLIRILALDLSVFIKHHLRGVALRSFSVGMIVAEIILGHHQCLLTLRKQEIRVLRDGCAAVRLLRLDTEIIEGNQHISGIVHILDHMIELVCCRHRRVVLPGTVLSDDVRPESPVIVQKRMKEDMRHRRHIHRDAGRLLIRILLNRRAQIAVRLVSADGFKRRDGPVVIVLHGECLRGLKGFLLRRRCISGI